MSDRPLTRRTLLKGAGFASLTTAMAQTGKKIAQRPLGRTGLQVSILGIGGYHLGSVKEEKDAAQIINSALDAGINFFDNAPGSITMALAKSAWASI